MVAGGQEAAGGDFGFRKLGSVAGTVWEDLDASQAQDGAEAGIAGVTVNLKSGATVVASATTDASGAFSFADVAPGTYDVAVDTASAALVGYTATTATSKAGVVVVGGQEAAGGDFGFRKLGSVAGTVWEDLDASQAQDGAEAGIAGVTVNLKSGATVVASATTDASGAFSFADVAPGTYDVAVDTASAALVGYTATTATSKAGVVVVGGQEAAGGDFGFRKLGSLSGTVYADANVNGTLQGGEAGLDGVTLTLKDGDGNVLTTAAGATDGAYSFAGLAPGIYTVEVGSPGIDWQASSPGALSVTVAAGQNTPDNNFGFWMPASIAGTAYTDLDTNSTYDQGTDTPLAGVTVTLTGTDVNGNTVSRTAVSAGDGSYTFPGLVPGDYSVSVGSPQQGQTLETAGTLAVTVAAGQDVTGKDFGFVPPPVGSAALGDTVWNDSNANGIRDNGEPGLAGVTVNLLDGSGQPVLVGGQPVSATTDAGGQYLFAGLAAGTYIVQFVAPADYAFSPALQGADRTKDSNANASTGKSGAVALAAGQSDLTVDAGLRGTDPGVALEKTGPATASRGDTITYHFKVTNTGNTWLYGGVTVSDPMLGGSIWHKTPVAPGEVNEFDKTYVIKSTDPTPLVNNATATGCPPGGLPKVTDPSTWTVTIGGGQTGSIGNKVWKDCDGDGRQDYGEPTFSGVKVTLTLPDGSTRTDTTDNCGVYGFSGLLAGNYTVTVDASTLPGGAAGWAPTYDKDGVSTPNTATVALAAGQSRTDVDFGYKAQPTGSIGNKVWKDCDGDGRQDYGEPTFSGVKVTLTLPDGSTRTDTTDNCGVYGFSGLAAGSYTVTVDASTLPGGAAAWAPTYDKDGTSTPNTATVTLAAGQDRTDVDFGYKAQPTGSIGNKVWKDCDGDGRQDSGDSVLSGVKVTLTLPDGSTRTDTTDNCGVYGFSGLLAGNYTVTVDASTLPGGAAAWAPTYDLDGIATAHTTAVTLAAGQDRTDVDFGYKAQSSKPFTTYTQGGWGSKPSGHNPGALLAANFDRLYDCDGVAIGAGRKVRFSSASAVATFLPAGGTAGVLACSATNPTSSAAGVFAGQVLALRLSVDCSNAGITRSGLADLKITSGKLTNYTLAQFLALCNSVIGGNTSALPAGVSIGDLNDAATRCNENFDNGTTDHGYLR